MISEHNNNAEFSKVPATAYRLLFHWLHIRFRYDDMYRDYDHKHDLANDAIELLRRRSLQIVH